jgi:RNA polymerase sigma-70 factor (ECF subfamily)
MSDDRSARIQRALARLAPPERELIDWYHDRNGTYEEIAAAMALPIGTVKSRLNRARLRLKAMLRESEGPEGEEADG